MATVRMGDRWRIICWSCVEEPEEEHHKRILFMLAKVYLNQNKKLSESNKEVVKYIIEEFYIRKPYKESNVG